MTPDERKAWFYDQAKLLLAQTSWQAAEITWLAYTHNAVFLLTQADERRVLRVTEAVNHPRLASEMAILDQLHRAGLAVPEFLALVEHDDTSGAMMAYLPGKTKSASDITASDVGQTGAFLARLHTIDIAPNERYRLDYAGLFTDEGLYPLTDEAKAVFTEDQLATMQHVADKVRDAMAHLGEDAAECGLIHGDFLLHNVLFHDGGVRALDFEYCGWGYYLYDLTPLLWQLKPQPNYADFRAALWAGYTQVRPLAQHHADFLETFIAGRQVASMRWVAANRLNPYYAGKVKPILAQRTDELRGFLAEGILQRN